MILSQALGQSVLKNPSGAAIFDLGKQLSFTETRNKISQLSYLYLSEIGHGKRIAFLTQNNPAAVLSFFAFTNIGCPVIFFDPNEPLEGIAQAIKDLEISVIAISTDQNSKVNELSRTFGLTLNTVEIEKKKGGEYDTSYSPPPEHPLKETDQALILRHEEAGSPVKYIFFTHKQVYTAASCVKRFYHFAAADKVLTTMSWSHPFALLHSLLTPLFVGVTCAINPQSGTHEEFIEYIAQHRINRFVDGPKFFYFLLSICSSAKYLLPGVKSITVGVGVLPKALRKTFQLLHVGVLQTHGRVEAVWTLAMEDLDKAKENINPVMETLPGFKYKVLNQEGDEITGDASREGPLAVTSETMMTAFFHPDKSMAEKSSKTTIRGTWFYTGEAARLEGEKEEVKFKPLGYLTDIIYSGSRYLLPGKIDDIAKEIQDVTDAAAFVRLDEKGKPSFALAVVKQSKLLSEAHIFQLLRSKLSDMEVPQTIHFVDEIPKDKFDNIKRTILQRQYSAR